MQVAIMDGAERQAAYDLNADFMQRMLAEAQQAAAAKMTQK